jgi:hypothetical protein
MIALTSEKLQVVAVKVPPASGDALTVVVTDVAAPSNDEIRSKASDIRRAFLSILTSSFFHTQGTAAVSANP